jgi:hypothetical protein
MYLDATYYDMNVDVTFLARELVRRITLVFDNINSAFFIEMQIDFKHKKKIHGQERSHA